MKNENINLLFHGIFSAFLFHIGDKSGVAGPAGINSDAISL